jgi:uncharacterized membrane protein
VALLLEIYLMLRNGKYKASFTYKTMLIICVITLSYAVWAVLDFFYLSDHQSLPYHYKKPLNTGGPQSLNPCHSIEVTYDAA